MADKVAAGKILRKNIVEVLDDYREYGAHADVIVLAKTLVGNMPFRDIASAVETARPPAPLLGVLPLVFLAEVKNERIVKLVRILSLANPLLDSFFKRGSTQGMPDLGALLGGISSMASSVQRSPITGIQGGTGSNSDSLQRSSEFETSMQVVTSLLGDAANNPIFKIARDIVSEVATGDDGANADLGAMMTRAQEKLKQRITNKDIDIEQLAQSVHRESSEPTLD
ncbi:hypothetical protein HDU93_007586 [Gonapodya sp. JEL0774]|nr:hypothetical protein HDU93_007586 [Gonapodya sp. JEL0774]